MYREWGPAVPGGGRGGCLGGAVRGHGFSDPQGLRAGFSRGPPPPLPDGSGITSPPPLFGIPPENWVDGFYRVGGWLEVAGLPGGGVGSVRAGKKNCM